MTAAKLTEIFKLSAKLSLIQIGLQTAGAIEHTVTTSIATAATVTSYVDRVYGLLSSESAQQHYRAVWRAIEIVWAVAVFLFLVIQREADRIVDECELKDRVLLPAAIEDKPEPAQDKPQAAIAPVEVIETAIVPLPRPVRKNDKGGMRDRRGFGVAIEV